MKKEGRSGFRGNGPTVKLGMSATGGKIVSKPRAVSVEAAILSRLIKQDLSPEAARALLQLDLDPYDRERMHELAVKNQEGALAPDEQEELDSCLRVGYFVDLMRSRARLALKRHGR
jgi:hypothetical protein